MDEFSWSDASALYQLQHGEAGPRTDSALAYLKARLDVWCKCCLDNECECKGEKLAPN